MTPKEKLDDFIKNDLDKLFENRFKILEVVIMREDPPDLMVKYALGEEEFIVWFSVDDNNVIVHVEFEDNGMPENACKEHIWAHTMFQLKERLQNLKKDLSERIKRDSFV